MSSQDDFDLLIVGDQLDHLGLPGLGVLVLTQVHHASCLRYVMLKLLNTLAPWHLLECRKNISVMDWLKNEWKSMKAKLHICSDSDL